MILPTSVNDPSLSRHEPLGSWLAQLYSERLDCRSRSGVNQTLDACVKEMQRDVQAAAAALKWASLLFDNHSLEITDDGSELYKVFLDYQLELSRESNDAKTCENRIRRNGLGAMKLRAKNYTTLGPRDAGGAACVTGQGKQRSSGSHTVSRLKLNRRQVKTGDQGPVADTARDSASGHGPDYIMDNTARQRSTLCGTTPAVDGISSILSEVTKPNKSSARQREKKRKASSQHPAIIAPSDGSEDDQERKTHAVTAANSVSHRTKRIVTSPPDNLTHISSDNQQARGGTNISETQLCHTGPHPENFVFSLSDKDGCGISFPLSSRKDKRRLNASIQVTQSSSNVKKERKMKSAGKLPARTKKRLRRACTPDGEGDGFDAAQNSNLRFPEELAVQRAIDTGPSSALGDIHKGLKAQKKRTRLDFEAGFVACHETSSTDSTELLGPDIRLKRPLPRKVSKQRSASTAVEDTAVRGVLHGGPSLEYVDQVLRDGASNALAILREEVGPEVPDWTQNDDQDAEGDDQDEINEPQVNMSTLAPLPVVSKPPLLAPPRIWAQSRQEVCESFEYFRSYHGGVYFRDDIVKGYLLGAHAACRDKFHHGGKLIISHGGGKSESIIEYRAKPGKPKRYQTDQDQQASDISVRALLRTCEDKRPVVLLADDKYALFPYDLTSGNYTYVVLGFYWITHAWAECQSARDGSGPVVRWKFTFQWCEDQGDPWWLPRQEMIGTPSDPKSVSHSSMKDSTYLADVREASTIQCGNCQKQSPFIYRQGWMCLNPKCDMFWSIDGEDPKQLDYREEFLRLLPHKFERLPEISPARVVKTQDGVTTTYAFSKGWHCTNCGRLSCRFKWEHWECSNCQFKHVVIGRARSPKEFWHQRPPGEFMHSRVAKDSGIIACRLEPINLGPQKGFTSRLTFILPHDRGKIHLILATPLSNREADEIFELYQRQASTGELKLRRYPLRNHRVRGQLLTNYFSQNSGEPYQYVGGTGNTVPFCEAPECVRRALAVIKERSNLALHSDISYNEILSAAYMERQKMSFHSDSEKGLGPIVASLSLGSAALMHFRLHVNAETSAPKNKCALTLVLRHGDVLVMEGDGVQKYYEHTVVPMNFRIAATARCIGSA